MEASLLSMSALDGLTSSGTYQGSWWQEQGGELMCCRGTAGAGGTAGAVEGDRSCVGAQRLSVHIPVREQARLAIIDWLVHSLYTSALPAKSVLVRSDTVGNLLVTCPMLMGVTMRPAAAGTVRVAWGAGHILPLYTCLDIIGILGIQMYGFRVII